MIILVRKEGWEPYPLKLKYLTPFVIYLIGIICILSWEWTHVPPTLANIIGIITLNTVFFIQYIVGIRRVFSDLVIKLKIYNFFPLIGWLIGTSIVILTQAVLFPAIMSILQVFFAYIFMTIASFFYFLGMILVIRDIKEISI